MTQASQQSTTVRVKPQPDIYTALLVVAILVLAAALGIVIWNLTSNYGLPFAEIFQSLKLGS
jgi:hypothetical protein